MATPQSERTQLERLPPDIGEALMPRKSHAQRPRIIPVSYRAARAFILQTTARPAHAANRPTARSDGRPVEIRRHVLSLAAITPAGQMTAVAQLAHPARRRSDDGATAELAHLTSAPTDTQTELVRSAWRHLQTIGYRRLICHTGASRDPTALRAAGMRRTGSKRLRRSRGTDWEIRIGRSRGRAASGSRR